MIHTLIFFFLSVIILLLGSASAPVCTGRG